MKKRKEKTDQNAVAELTREGLYKENKWLWEENKNLKGKIKRLEFDVDAWHQLKLLLEGEIEKLKEYNGELIENHKKDMAILCEENKKLKEENEKLNLHIEAKDEAYMKLLKDYEKIKDDREYMKEKLENDLGNLLCYVNQNF